MPYFTFKINNEVHFRCKLDSLRCTDKTKSGTQCKRKCVIGSPYCCTHLQYKHYLKIKTSLISNSGKGLFVTDPQDSTHREIIFDKGEIIVKYCGEIIDLHELEDRYGAHTAPYAVKISNNRFEDCAKTRGVGSLANTKAGDNNATFSIYRGFASLRATKNIRNGDEIYLSYGPAYGLHKHGVEYGTTAK